MQVKICVNSPEFLYRSECIPLHTDLIRPHSFPKNFFTFQPEASSADHPHQHSFHSLNHFNKNEIFSSHFNRCRRKFFSFFFGENEIRVRIFIEKKLKLRVHGQVKSGTPLKVLTPTVVQMSKSLLLLSMLLALLTSVPTKEQSSIFLSPVVSTMVLVTNATVLKV